MKITKRMKKILLFLLHPENTLQWFKENKISIAKGDYYRYWEIMSFCEKKPYRYEWDSTRIERISYRRTFKILEKLGLVEGRKLRLSWGVFEYPHYKLTNEGKKIAKEIEKEIRGFIKEYDYLVS